MKVSELIVQLQAMPQDALVVQSRDGEGNQHMRVADISLGRFNEKDHEWGLYELTPELRAQQYSEEDLVDGPTAVCIWPE